MRELAVQSANDTNTASDRASLQSEVRQLQAEIDRIATTTTFNGKKMLDGTFSAAKFQVGADANQTISMSIASSEASDMGINRYVADYGSLTWPMLGDDASSLVNTLASGTLSLAGAFNNSPYDVDIAVAAGSSAGEIADLANAKTDQTGITATAVTKAKILNLQVDGTVSFNLYGKNTTGEMISATVTTTDLTNLVSAINARTGTTGITAEISDGDKSAVTLTSANGDDIVLENYADSGAAGATMDIWGLIPDFPGMMCGTFLPQQGHFDSVIVGGYLTFDSSNAGFTVTYDDQSLTGDTNAHGSSVIAASTIDIGDQSGANDALAIIDGALAMVDDIRGDLGAIQNRFESTIANINSVSENLTSARSRILDADIAAETSAMTRSNILQQAGVAILAQANQMPQLALSLLK